MQPSYRRRFYLRLYNPGFYTVVEKAFFFSVSDGIASALEELCDQNENSDTQGQAHDILDATQRVSFLSFLHFRKEILRGSYDA